MSLCVAVPLIAEGIVDAGPAVRVYARRICALRRVPPVLDDGTVVSEGCPISDEQLSSSNPASFIVFLFFLNS